MEYWYLWPYIAVVVLWLFAGGVRYSVSVCERICQCPSDWSGNLNYAIFALERPPCELRLTYSGLLGMFAVLVLTTTVFPCEKCWTWMNVNALVQIVTLLMAWGIMAQSIRAYEHATPEWPAHKSYYAVLSSSVHSAAAVATVTAVLAAITGTDIWQLTEDFDFWTFRVLTVLVVYVIYRGMFSRLNLLLLQLSGNSEVDKDGLLVTSTHTLLICAIFPPAAALLLVAKELWNGPVPNSQCRIFAYNAFLQISVSFFNHGIPPIGVDYGGGDAVGSGGSALGDVGLKAVHRSVSAELTTESKCLVLTFFVFVFMPGAQEVALAQRQGNAK